MHLAMHSDEADLLKSLLLKDNSYLEFGAGGSTFMAAQSDLREIHCVETDPTWIEQVKAQVGDTERIHFHHVDIGPTREWGLPATDLPNCGWTRYYLDIWSKLDAAPDIVLIDGRFRTACGLMACLACPSTSVIAMHDFYDPLPARKNYHRVLEFLDQIERATNLVVFRKKASVDQFRLLSVLAAVREDYW